MEEKKILMQTRGRNCYLMFPSQEKWRSDEEYKKIVALILIFWILTVDIKVSYEHVTSIHLE
jgi:hypothetical protein